MDGSLYINAISSVSISISKVFWTVCLGKIWIHLFETAAYTETTLGLQKTLPIKRVVRLVYFDCVTMMEHQQTTEMLV